MTKYFWDAVLAKYFWRAAVFANCIQGIQGIQVHFHLAQFTYLPLTGGETASSQDNCASFTHFRATSNDNRRRLHVSRHLLNARFALGSFETCGERALRGRRSLEWFGSLANSMTPSKTSKCFFLHYLRKRTNFPGAFWNWINGLISFSSLPQLLNVDCWSRAFSTLQNLY